MDTHDTQLSLIGRDALVIAGMDEVGRGSLAGPVVAAACVLSVPLYRRRSTASRWSPFRNIPDEDVLIADSKMLEPRQRERTFAWLSEHAVFGVGWADQSYVDERGILAATKKAMDEALASLLERQVCDGVLVDGRDAFRFPIPHQSIIKGDSKEPAIAAASIVAKVTRDRFMREQHALFPAYGFDGHKGYGSSGHLAAIAKNGPCPLHRRSFLKRFLEDEKGVIIPLF